MKDRVIDTGVEFSGGEFPEARVVLFLGGTLEEEDLRRVG
jgi:hypothetical protein